jgi:hypothetical protein
MRALRAGLTVLAVAVACSEARGSYPRPFWSFAKPSPDGQYLFVVIGEKDHSAIGREIEPVDAANVRNSYPKSGLYRNDGSKEPLWALDLLCYPNEVHVSSDGIHLVVRGRQTIRFYASGVLVRAHGVEELVDNPARQDRTSTTSGNLWLEADKFDDANLQYSLTTTDGNWFLFDVRSGECVSAWRPVRWLFQGLALLVALPLLLKGARRFVPLGRRTGAGKEPTVTARFTRLPFVTLVAFALLTVAWYTVLGRHRSWGWVVAGVALAGGMIGVGFLLREREPFSWSITRPRLTADRANFALGLVLAAVAIWVY